MTALDTDLNMALERALAARREVGVPVGLARRIVVRTVNLPQTFGPTPSCAVERAYLAKRQRTLLWHYALPGALAASIASLVFGTAAFGPAAGSPDLTLEAGSPSQIIASVEGHVPKAIAQSKRPAEGSDTETGQSVLSRSVVAEASANSAPRSYGGQETLVAQMDNTELLSGLSHLPKDVELNEFSLADRGPGRPEVYGPVIDPEAAKTHANVGPGISSAPGTAMGFTSPVP